MTTEELNAERFDRLADLAKAHATHMSKELAQVGRGALEDRLIDRYIRAFLVHARRTLAEHDAALRAVRVELEHCESRERALRDELALAKLRVEGPKRQAAISQRIEAAARAVRDASSLVDARARLLAELGAAVDACPLTEWEHRIAAKRNSDPRDRANRVIAIDGAMLSLFGGESIPAVSVAGVGEEARA